MESVERTECNQHRFVGVYLWPTSRGYVGYASVHDKLTEFWGKGSKTIQFLSRTTATMMNDALRAAASLGPQKTGYLSDRTLITMYYDDIGEVDFYRLSFLLFGLRIQSYY